MGPKGWRSVPNAEVQLHGIQPICQNDDSGGQNNLVYVIVQPNESIDAAVKRFNMKLQQSGLLRELKEHAHYEKPSEKRRRMKRRSRAR